MALSSAVSATEDQTIRTHATGAGITDYWLGGTDLDSEGHVVNEWIAFVLELVMLFALGRWGAKQGATLAASVLFGAGAPLAAAVVWGLFAAPKARVRLPMAGILSVKFLAFGSGVLAVYALGRHAAAGALAATALANTAIAAVDRDAAMRARERRVRLDT